MAALFGSAWILLMSVLGSHALDLLRANATSQNPPPAPTVHCRCASYPNMTLCSWAEPPHSLPVHYIATYSERHRRGSTKPCHLFSPNSLSADLVSSSSTSGQMWHCHLPDLKFLTDYIINITAVHSGGSSSHLKSFMLEDIVKPDPPVDVRVSPHSGRSLLVEWSPPPAWTYVDLFPLKYNIMYQFEYRGIPKFVNLGPLENTRIELKGLTLGRTYLFQVCAKELLGLGECSDWSSPVKFTIPRTKL